MTQPTAADTLISRSPISSPQRSGWTSTLRTVRCPATQVDLETGERDCDVPRLLREHFGHADLGVHAAVLEGGRVAVGDSLEPV